MKARFLAPAWSSAARAGNASVRQASLNPRPFRTKQTLEE
jgi:hypothetical protein